MTKKSNGHYTAKCGGCRAILGEAEPPNPSGISVGALTNSGLDERDGLTPPNSRQDWILHAPGNRTISAADGFSRDVQPDGTVIYRIIRPRLQRDELDIGNADEGDAAIRVAMMTVVDARVDDGLLIAGQAEALRTLIATSDVPLDPGPMFGPPPGAFMCDIRGPGEESPFFPIRGGDDDSTIQTDDDSRAVDREDRDASSDANANDDSGSNEDDANGELS